MKLWKCKTCHKGFKQEEIEWHEHNWFDVSEELCDRCGKSDTIIEEARWEDNSIILTTKYTNKVLCGDCRLSLRVVITAFFNNKNILTSI